jgi:hypothetical protein
MMTFQFVLLHCVILKSIKTWIILLLKIIAPLHLVSLIKFAKIIWRVSVHSIGLTATTDRM